MNKSSGTNRDVVCVQGLGFVGAAMACAVANASNGNGDAAFDVIGVDLPTPEGLKRIDALKNGRFPFATTDNALVEAARHGQKRGNLVATSETSAFESADTIIVDVNLDVDTDVATTDFTAFRAAIRAIGERAKSGCLILVETTVPPGTCEKIVLPELADCLQQRNLPPDALMVAHSYERVMPGPDYFNSIINYWRVFAGNTPEAAAACRSFLERVINTDAFPLTQLSSLTASETAKVVENTFRAVTISLMDEWGEFAQAAGIDMFEIADAIRARPTHKNLRQPGFGVGGYCLTKDPLFGLVAARQLFEVEYLEFPVSRAAVTINKQMPLRSLAILRKSLGGSLAGKSILLLGVSYRSEVDDTRHSPSEVFTRSALDEGARVVCHDPFVRDWPETGLPVLGEMPDPSGFDAVVLAVDHQFYRRYNFSQWLGAFQPIIIDSNNVLDNEMRARLKANGIPLLSIGRGS